jgi:hypothetical protein
MNQNVIAVVAAVMFPACIGQVQAQTTMTLRYGQIPSTIKSVSALHFNIAQRKGLFIREGINMEMIAIDGGMGETGDLKPQLPSAERFVDLQYLRAAGIQ